MFDLSIECINTSFSDGLLVLCLQLGLIDSGFLCDQLIILSGKNLVLLLEFSKLVFHVYHILIAVVQFDF